MEKHTAGPCWMYCESQRRVKDMLILKRKAGEQLRIGDDIVVQIISVDGNQTRVGIAAPRDLPVHREEIYNKIQREQK